MTHSLSLTHTSSKLIPAKLQHCSIKLLLQHLHQLMFSVSVSWIICSSTSNKKTYRSSQTAYALRSILTVNQSTSAYGFMVVRKSWEKMNHLYKLSADSYWPPCVNDPNAGFVVECVCPAAMCSQHSKRNLHTTSLYSTISSWCSGKPDQHHLHMQHAEARTLEEFNFGQNGHVFQWDFSLMY